MEFFLKTRSWKLFLMLYGIPISVLFLLPQDVVLVEPTPLNESLSYSAFLIFVGLYLLWLWSVGNLLRKRVVKPSEITGYHLYKLGFAVFAAYFITVGYVLVRYSSKPTSPAWVFPVLVTLHITATVCIFQVAGFNARVLRAAEKRPVQSNDWVADMLLFIVYPIGLWFLQPRINRVFRERINTI